MKRKYYGRIRAAVALALLLFAIICLSGRFEAGARLLAFQPGPVWVKLAGGVTGLGIGMTVFLLGMTFVFGRFFCAVLCPLGTTQDLVAMLRPKTAGRIPNAQWVRYSIAAAALFCLAGGWAIGFRLLDPFSRFGAIVATAGELPSLQTSEHFIGLALGGALPFVLLVALVLWKKRLYCVSLCPVGTVLGLFAKYGLFGMRMKDSCTGCGICAKHCPTGCIDSAARAIDNERCLLCLQCTSVCPSGSVGYTSAAPSHTANEAPPVDGSRRGFLLAGAAVALGAAGTGFGLSGVIRRAAGAAENAADLVLPPGAIGAERFARRCTSCQLCTASCPAGIIAPSPYGFGPVRLDYTHAGCRYDCTACNTVCPSGALRQLELADKQWLKVGEAVFDARKCRVTTHGEACSLCAEACPKEAIFMVEGSSGLPLPEVAAFHCIGCGMCQAVCPAKPKALVVQAIEQKPMGI